MKRRKPREHVRRVRTKLGRRPIIVNKGIKKRSKKVKRKMAWAVLKPYDYVEEMSPDEYLKRVGSPDFAADTYYDDETDKREPLTRLGRYISDKNKIVDVPFIGRIDKDNTLYRDQEGRHRALAAKKAGIKKIPVKMTPPKTWLNDEILDDLLKERFKGKYTTKEELEKHKEKIKRTPFPEDYLDISGRKIWVNKLKEKGVIEDEEG